MASRPLVLAGTADGAREFPFGRRRGDVEARLVPRLPDLDELDLDRPTVVLLDRGLMRSVADAPERAERLARVAALVACGAPGEDEPAADLPLHLVCAFVPGDASERTTALALRGAVRHAQALCAERAARAEEARRRAELAELTDVGAALATQHDLLALLELILTQARRFTNGDAASLYLLERADGAEPRLRFKLSQNFSRPALALGEFTLPVDHSSLAGYVASTGEVVAVPDVYRLAEDSAFTQNRTFDERFGYRTRSVLVLPLQTHHGTVVGVLQLINRKRDPHALLGNADDVAREVLPFDRRSIELVSALAAQAAVAIENRILSDSIERLFESFVSAAVTAIETRDPCTFGHSERVATLAVGLAEALERHGTGPYAGTRFSRMQLRELRYAALLHDFGKVSVPEEVLVKATKLYRADLERVGYRFAQARQAALLDFERGRADLWAAHGSAGTSDAIARLEQARERRLGTLAKLWLAVEAANEPTAQPAAMAEPLAALELERFVDADGREHRLVTDAELALLRIERGTFSAGERAAFQAHVAHTQRFLSVIPWTPELRSVPEIAYAHHEKLNGVGYPRGLRGDAIPLQARILTIADIYDALTATDRVYKKAMPHEQAARILSAEAAAGELDADLVRAFVEARVWAVAEPTPALTCAS